MYRALPLLLLAALPAAVAAPVPREVLPEFGFNGLLTEDDLEKVKFDSRPVMDKEVDDAVSKAREIEELRKVEDVRKKERFKERPKNLYDVAVHMPQTKFRPGEPVPAYFVLRNNRPTRLS